MDRASTERMELEEVYQELPEFRLFKHCLPFASWAQQHRIIMRMSRLVKRQGECLIWCGHCNNDGYPKLNTIVLGAHRSLYVHHLAFSMANGREPRDWEDHSHKCDIAACISPEHIFAERSKENQRRGAINANRARARALRKRRRQSEERA